MVVLKSLQQKQGKGGGWLFPLLRCLKFAPLLTMVVYLVTLLISSSGHYFDDNPTAGDHDYSAGLLTPSSTIRLQLRGVEEPVTTSINTPRDKQPWRSSHSAVLAMATNYDMKTYQTFIGSIRATGYTMGISY